MKLLLIVGTGSFIGGVLRFIIAQWVQAKTPFAFPFGTLAINVIGCFIIGAVFGLGERSHIPSEWRLFMMTGLCGGFTTFSAFGLETVSLFRDGQHFYGTAYVTASLALGLLATYTGILLFK